MKELKVREEFWIQAFNHRVGPLFLWLGLLVSISGLALAQDKFQVQIPEEAVVSLEEARKDRIEGRTDIARQKLERLLLERPDYYRARYNLGLLEYDDGKIEASKEILGQVYEIREAREVKIQDNTIYSAYGWICFVDGDFRQAEAVLKKGYQIVKNEPNSKALTSNLLSNLGELYYVTGRFDEAVKILTEAYDDFGNQKALDTLKRIDEYQEVRKKLASAENPDSLVLLLSSERSAVRKAASFTIELRNDKTALTAALWKLLDDELRKEAPSRHAVVNSTDLLGRVFKVHTPEQLTTWQNLAEQWTDLSIQWSELSPEDIQTMKEMFSGVTGR